jgi:hypothetical protein
VKIKYIGLFGTALTLALTGNAVAQEQTGETPEIELSPQGLEILCERFPLNSRCEGGTPLTGPAPTGTVAPDATTPIPPTTAPVTPGGTTPLDPTAPPVTPLPGPDGTMSPDTMTPPGGPAEGTTLPPESPTGGGTRVAPESPINAPDGTSPDAAPGTQGPGTDMMTPPGGMTPTPGAPASPDGMMMPAPGTQEPGTDTMTPGSVAPTPDAPASPDGMMMPAPGTDSTIPTSPTDGVTP